jgi:hypothetical protein
MSSQGFNSSVNRGFTTQTDNTGILPEFPLRDAADYTRMLKQRSVYRENKSGSPFKGSPSPHYPIKQSAETYIDSAFGRVRCVGCTGGAFPI